MRRSSLGFGLVFVIAACGTSGSSPAPAPQPSSSTPLPQLDAAVPTAPQPADWLKDVSLAELPDENPDPNIVEVTLEAKTAMVSIGSMRVEMWTYNGTVPGPILRAKKGNTLRVHVKNALPAATLVHWHGVRVPNGMDGTEMVQTPIAPGGRFDYEFVVPDEGTYWYHSHFQSSTQVGYGLYGALVVEPESSPPLPEEATLVLSDVSIDDVTQKLKPGDENGGFGDLFGREGNHVLVNGRERPRLGARVGLAQRWRFINAARAKFFQLDFGSHSVFRIGTDGGRIEQPVSTKGLLLVPGERAELYVIPRGVPGTTVPLMTKSYDRFHVAPDGVPTPLFEVALSVDPPSPEIAPPVRLATVRGLTTTGVTERRIEFSQVLVNGETRFGINGKNGADVPAVTVPAGTVELWTVYNTTKQDHPFHMHGFFFQVVSINSKPVTAHEWKDNVNLRPDDSYTLAVDFDARPGMWMYHCHILDHVDSGMMGMLHVH